MKVDLRYFCGQSSKKSRRKATPSLALARKRTSIRKFAERITFTAMMMRLQPQITSGLGINLLSGFEEKFNYVSFFVLRGARAAGAAER